jgi:hypothetical protein
VALPALARTDLHVGAGDYGTVLASFGAGALLGTLTAGQIGRSGRPALEVSAVFLTEAGLLGLAPVAGGLGPVLALSWRAFGAPPPTTSQGSAGAPGSLRAPGRS